MTVPNGADGINTTDGWLMVSAYGHGDLSAADLVGNDEDTVRAMAADRFVNNGNSVFSDPTGPLALVWDGLEQGISLPLAIISALVNNLFPGIDFPSSVSGVLDLIEEVPILGDIVEAITGVVGNLGDLTSFFEDIPIIGDLVAALTGGTGDLADLSTFFTNFFGILSGGGTTGGVPVLDDILGFFTDIPILGDIVEAITGAVGNLGDLTDFFNELFGAFGGATDLGGIGSFITDLLGSFGGATGTSGVDSFITDLLGSFGGASNPLDVGSFITDLLGSFGGATGTAGVDSFITDLLGSFGGATGTAGVDSFITGLLGSFGGAASLTQVDNFLTNLLSLFNTPTGLTTTPGSFDPLASGLELIDAFIPGLGSLIDGLFNGFTGDSVSGASQSAVNSATASQADAVSGQGALIEQIKAAIGAGTPDADDFERASLGSTWTVGVSSGTVTIPDGHNLKYSGTGSSAEFAMRKNDKVSATDHITSTVVLNTTIPAWIFPSPAPFGGFVDVWVRQTAWTTFATRTGVVLRVNSNGFTASWVLYKVASGTFTSLTSGSCNVPAAGAALSLEAGAGGNMRRFLGTLAGTPICDYTDTGLTTVIGTANRYRGLGGKGNAFGIATPQGAPAIRQWTAQG